MKIKRAKLILVKLLRTSLMFSSMFLLLLFKLNFLSIFFVFEEAARFFVIEYRPSLVREHS